MCNARLDEAQAGIKIARRNINKLRYADDTIIMAESEEELKNFLMKVKEESEKAVLKLSIQKKNKKNQDHGIQSHHFLANKWGNNGNNDRLYFLGLQNHCSDCSHARHLLHGRKAMTNLHNIFKSRNITLLTNWVSEWVSECVKSLSCVLFVTPWTVGAYHAPLSMGFSRQEYWSRLPFPSPEDLPNPGIEPGSPTL